MTSHLNNLREIVSRYRTGRTYDIEKSGQAISDFYSNLDPVTQKALLGALAGSVIGGGISGLLSLFDKKDPEYRHGTLREALLGATLGGVAGAGLPVFYHLFKTNFKDFNPKSGVSSKDSIKRPLVYHSTKTLNELSKPFTDNFGVTLGGILGTHYALKDIPLYNAPGAPQIPNPIIRPTYPIEQIKNLKKIVEDKIPGSKPSLLHVFWNTPISKKDKEVVNLSLKDRLNLIPRIQRVLQTSKKTLGGPQAIRRLAYIPAGLLIGLLGQELVRGNIGR